MRYSAASATVAKALLSQRSKRQWGYDLCKRSGVKSGVLYPILARMEGEGWLRSDWDDSTKPGARRRFYEVTDEGAKAMKEMVKP